MAHSNESKVCSSPPLTTSNDLSYSFPQTSHIAIAIDSPSVLRRPWATRSPAKPSSRWKMRAIVKTPLSDLCDGFLVDLDGVVWVGGEVIEGADETLATLRADGKGVVFLTNDPRG